MTDFIPDGEEIIEPKTRAGHHLVGPVLEGLDGWGANATLYEARFDNAAGGFVLGDGHSVPAIVGDVIERLYAIGLLHDGAKPSPINALAAAAPTEADIEQVATYLRDLADHVRFEDPPRGLGHQALIGQEGNVLMAYRLAMTKHGLSLAHEIQAARDILLAHAKAHPFHATREPNVD